MPQVPHLIEVSLDESKGGSSNSTGPTTKKLITAVSIEAPDLFRIRGVPCVDRGPDKLRLPVAFEHWRVDGSARREDFFATGAAVQPAKKTSNFARPSSVSEDTPNFFKVPGVAINRSSAITGVDAVCSPPPDHEPFNLPGTYMHGKEAQAVRDRAVLPGQWRETGGGTGQWGHATREFHELLTKMRREGDARGQQKADPSNQPPPHKKTPTTGEQSAPPRQRHKSSDSDAEKAPRIGSNESVNAVGVSPIHSQAPHDDSTSVIVSATKAAAARERRHRNNGSEVSGGGSAGEEKRQEAGNSEEGRPQKQQQRGRRRRASAVEVFMSRLDGERAPRNRRESVAAYKRLLVDCQTNNSAEFRDDAAATTTTTVSYSDSLLGARAAGAATTATATAAAATDNASTLRGVLVRRNAAEKAVARLMGTAEGSYMLSPDADMSKIRLGREKLARTPQCGVVRVSDTGGSRSNRR